LNWLVSLAHARVVIELWHQEYNDERPKKSFGGMTPSQYAKRLAAWPLTMPADYKHRCYRKQKDVDAAAMQQ